MVRACQPPWLTPAQSSWPGWPASRADGGRHDLDAHRDARPPGHRPDLVARDGGHARRVSVLDLAVSILLAAYCAVAALSLLAQAIGPGPRVKDPAAAGQATMNAGMAAMLLAML